VLAGSRNMEIKLASCDLFLPDLFDLRERLVHACTFVVHGYIRVIRVSTRGHNAFVAQACNYVIRVSTRGRSAHDGV
jgi:hypothetical protein